MEEVTTLEQAVEWCSENEATVHFQKSEVNIYIQNEWFVGSGSDLIEAVNDAIAFVNR